MSSLDTCLSVFQSPYNVDRPADGDRGGAQKSLTTPEKSLQRRGGAQKSLTTPEKSLQRMLNTTGLHSESDAEAGSNEAEEDDDDEDEPDLDALATRLSAKVCSHRGPQTCMPKHLSTRLRHLLGHQAIKLAQCQRFPEKEVAIHSAPLQ